MKYVIHIVRPHTAALKKKKKTNNNEHVLTTICQCHKYATTKRSDF